MKRRWLVHILTGLLAFCQTEVNAEEQILGAVDGEAERFQFDCPIREETTYSEVVEELNNARSLKELRERVTARRAIDFITLYKGGEVEEDYSKYDKVSHLEIFAKCAELEFTSDPVYIYEKLEYAGWYAGSDGCIIAERFPYEEEMWNSLGSTLRRKHGIVRVADRLVRKVRDVTTLSYESESGISAKARPAIVNSREIKKTGVRIFARNIPFISSIDSRFMFGGDTIINIGKDLDFAGRASEGRFYLGYEFYRETGDEDGKFVREHRIFVGYWKRF